MLKGYSSQPGAGSVETRINIGHMWRVEQIVKPASPSLGFLILSEEEVTKNMTNKKLNTFFTFRVTIAVLIAAAIIFLPAAVLAETVDTTNGGSSTPEEIEAGGFEADGDSFDTAPDTTADLSTSESGVGDTALLPEAPAPVTDSNPVDQTSDLSEIGDDSGEPEPAGVGDNQAPISGHEGNSYTAEVTSERVLATSGVDTGITVSFTEVCQVTPLGSDQMTLPVGF